MKNKLSIKYFIDLSIIVIMGCFFVFFCYKYGRILHKTEKFVDNYKIYDSLDKHIIQDTIRDTLKEFTIKGNWLISFDPNSNWMRFQYDPNRLQLKKEGK